MDEKMKRLEGNDSVKAFHSPLPRVVIIGDGDDAVRCCKFFRKYGFSVHPPVNPAEHTIDCASLAGLGCPVILATKNVAVRRTVAETLRSNGLSNRYIIQDETLYSLALEQLIDLLSFNGTTTPNEYVKALLGVYPASARDPLVPLAAYQSLKIKNALDRSRKTLGVFYPSCAYRANLGSSEMYHKIRRQGYNVVFLFGAICNDEFEKRPRSYYAGHGIVGYMDFIDVFFFPTLTDLLPERSKKVLIVHDIWDSPKGKAEAPVISPDGTLSTSPLLNELDYTFLPATSVMPDDDAPQHKRKKPLCRIPGGYMKLDRNIEYIKSSTSPLDSIVYAPTVINDNFSEYVSLPGFGKKIIGALLDNFPDYRIIFRPHPHTLASEYVAMIVERFSQNSRFVFDSNASFYMENYCRSALMVSDMSGTAFTYAFTTLRPVVFFSHDEVNVEAAFDGVAYFKDRDKVGCVATNIAELVEMVASSLDQTGIFAEKIKQFRDSTMFNVGRVEEYLAENISYIMEEKRHPHWQYVCGPSVIGREEG